MIISNRYKNTPSPHKTTTITPPINWEEVPRKLPSTRGKSYVRGITNYVDWSEETNIEWNLPPSPTPLAPNPLPPFPKIPINQKT